MNFQFKLLFSTLLIVIGFDFILHAGILNSLYDFSNPFFIDPNLAAKLIPLGYFSFLIQIYFLNSLIMNLEINNEREGFKFGIKFGMVIWTSLILGLISIAAIPIYLAIGWLIGQIIELGIAGYVLCMKPPISFSQSIMVLLTCILLGVIFQNLSSF